MICFSWILPSPNGVVEQSHTIAGSATPKTIRKNKKDENPAHTGSDCFRCSTNWVGLAFTITNGPARWSWRLEFHQVHWLSKRWKIPHKWSLSFAAFEVDWKTKCRTKCGTTPVETSPKVCPTAHWLRCHSGSTGRLCGNIVRKSFRAGDLKKRLQQHLQESHQFRILRRHFQLRVWTQGH